MNENKIFTSDEEDKVKEEAKERIRKHGLVDYSDSNNDKRILKTLIDVFKTDR